MLLDPCFREGAGRVGILGTTKADQRSGFPIGVQFFGALGAKCDTLGVQNRKILGKDVKCIY
jgi:hypothetical protein